jgi:hypothetical protein
MQGASGRPQPEQLGAWRADFSMTGARRTRLPDAPKKSVLGEIDAGEQNGHEFSDHTL